MSLNEKIFVVIDSRSALKQDEVYKALDYRKLNPLREFNNVFAIDEDLLLLDTSTNLVWGKDGWTSDLTKAVRGDSKRNLKKQIPWYEKLLKDFYRISYYKKMGWDYSKINLENEINNLKVVSQSRII
jgi:hypothetical protein